MTQTAHWFFWLFVILYFLHLAIETGLDVLNLNYLKKHRDKIPELFQNVFSFEEYQKSIEYTQTKLRFHWIQQAFSVVVIWLMILGQFFGWMDRFVANYLPEGTLIHQIAYPLAIAVVFYLLSLPFNIYFQFVIEERFGFNKTTAKTYITDQIKTILISLALGIPLLAILFKLVESLGSYWWIAGWGVVLLFQLFFTALFPVIFVPLFYKLTPLSEGVLKERLIELAKKLKFRMSGIYTIDSSKRSTHSNAFFAGIGKAKRIVLFDTLVNNLTISEIVCVIGHEMGHNKLHHVLKNLLLGAVTSFVGFFILSKVLMWPPFFNAFGISNPSAHTGLVLFALFSGVFTFPLNPLMKWLSRKYEYESDQFSAKVTCEPQCMTSSLVKLSKDNLANLTPHPWYSFYHYSHPTTTERAEALKSVANSLH